LWEKKKRLGNRRNKFPPIREGRVKSNATGKTPERKGGAWQLYARDGEGCEKRWGDFTGLKGGAERSRRP